MLMKLFGEVGVSFVQRYSLLPSFNLPISICERLSLKQTYLTPKYLTPFDLAVWHMAAPKSKVCDLVVTIIFVFFIRFEFF